MAALFPDTHPKMEALQIELQRRLAGLLLGEEIACKVYGKLPLTNSDIWEQVPAGDGVGNY